MEIIPAIDLKDGVAVRLNKGDMKSAKMYSHKPASLAKEFEILGAKWLHIVDLDGACSGEPKNSSVISNIVKSTNLNIQVGGGIRDEEKIKYYVDLGVKRVILGSIALKDPYFVKEMAKKYEIFVGIDAKDGFVAVNGWSKISPMKASDLAKDFLGSGVKGIICTDISKDGMLSGINLDFTKSIANASKIPTYASGGVKDMKDLMLCKKSQIIAGVIIGKAYYEGRIDLKSALSLS